MTLRIVQMGSARKRGEGVRLGTVRRPPRGVQKSRYAVEDYYDVWLPDLAPSAELLRATRSITWETFQRRFKGEMNRPQARRLLDVLAALSHTSNFSVGCYCGDQTRCHRSVLRDLFVERNAKLG